MEFKKVTNGRAKVANKKRSTRRKKRNSAAKAAPRKANSVARARATPVVANKRRKRSKRRNGVTAVAKVANKKRKRTTHRRRNGFLGNSKETGMKVLQLGAGVVAVKALNGLVGRFTNSLLASWGFGPYALPINEALTAVGLGVIGGYAGKYLKMSDLGGDLMLGGLVVAGIDGANAVTGASQFNIFNQTNTPVFLAGAAAGAQAAVNEVANNGLTATAAKMGMLPRGNMDNVRQMHVANGANAVDLNATM